MITKINGKVVTKQEIDSWKLERIPKVLKTLGADVKFDGTADEQMEQLTNLKLSYGNDKIYTRLEKSLDRCDFMTRLILKLSGKKRCYSKITITGDGVSAKEVADLVNEINLNAEGSKEYERVNIRACPDHYILRATGGNGLEVIETTGNNSLPSRFYINYGDETGLSIPRDPACMYQSVGVARDKSGTVIGGVRHQFFDTDTGFEARLAVEFPGKAPKSMVESHKMHLAAEFGYWLQWIIDHAGK